MRILIDLVSFSRGYHGGVRRFALDLTRQLSVSQNITVVCSPTEFDFLKNVFPNINVVSLRFYNFYRLFGKISILLSLIFGELYFYLFMKFVSKYFVPNRDVFEVVYHPLATKAFDLQSKFSVLSVHDLQHEVFPGNFSYLQRRLRKIKYGFSLQSSDVVQVSSNFIGDEVLKFYPGISERILLIPEFVDDLFVQKVIIRRQFYKNSSSSELNKIVLFYPAQIWAHKGHLDVFQSLKAITDDFSDLRVELILCGAVYDQNIFCQISNFVTDNFNIVHRGIVNDDVLIDLFASCDSVLIPTFYESSSLPLIEAALASVPVIIRRIPVAVELSKYLNFETFESVDELKSCIFKVKRDVDKSLPLESCRRFLLSSVALKYSELFQSFVGRV